jgi:hypothetical protein
MDRSLTLTSTPISEDETHDTGSSTTTLYDEPTYVTPKVRSFSETIQRRNTKSERLKQQIMALQT